MSNRLNSPQGNPSDETPMEFLVRCLDFSGLLEQQDLALFSGVSDNPQFVMYRLIRDGKLSEFQVNEFMNQYDQYRMNWERKRDCFAVIDILVQLGYRTQAQAASYKNAVENLGYRQISAEDFLKRLIAGNKISRGQAQTALNELRDPLAASSPSSTARSGATPPLSPGSSTGSASTPPLPSDPSNGGVPPPPIVTSGTPPNNEPLWESHEESWLARIARPIDRAITWTRLAAIDVTNMETPVIPHNYVLTYGQRTKMIQSQFGPKVDQHKNFTEDEQNTLRAAEIERVQNEMRTEAKIEESEQKLQVSNQRIQQLENSISEKSADLEQAKNAVRDAENEWNTDLDDYQEKSSTLALSGSSATNVQKREVIDADQKRRQSKRKFDDAKKQQNALETEIKNLTTEMEKLKKDAEELGKKVQPAKEELEFMADSLRAFNDCMRSVAETTLAIQQVSSIAPASVRLGDEQLRKLDEMYENMCTHMFTVVNIIRGYIKPPDATKGDVPTKVDTKTELYALLSRIELIEDIAGHLASKWGMLTTSWAQEAGASSAFGINPKGGMMKRQNAMREIHKEASTVRMALKALKISGGIGNEARKQAAQEAAEEILKKGTINVKGIPVKLEKIRSISDYIRGNLIKIILASELLPFSPVGLATDVAPTVARGAWGLTKSVATRAADYAVPDSWFAEENESTIPPLFNQEHTRQEDIPDL